MAAENLSGVPQKLSVNRALTARRVPLGLITVVAHNLKDCGESVFQSPTIRVVVPQFLPVQVPVSINVVEAKKADLRLSATRTLSSIPGYNLRLDLFPAITPKLLSSLRVSYPSSLVILTGVAQYLLSVLISPFSGVATHSQCDLSWV